MCDKDGISKQRGQNRLFTTWGLEDSLPLNLIQFFTLHKMQNHTP